jgi:hypothetical protein
MKTVGVILIVLGILGFAVTGISFTTEEEVADVGPVEVNREEERSIPFTPLASGGAIVVGIGLVIAGRRRDT